MPKPSPRIRVAHRQNLSHRQSAGLGSANTIAQTGNVSRKRRLKTKGKSAAARPCRQPRGSFLAGLHQFPEHFEFIFERPGRGRAWILARLRFQLRRGNLAFRCDGLACRAVVRSVCEKLCVVARLRSTSTRQPSFSTTLRTKAGGPART